MTAASATSRNGPAPAGHAAVVYNPIKVNLGRLRASVASAATGWGETQWFATTPEDPGQQAARQALAQGASVILVAGGDGTVRAVAEVLRGSEARLAIVPSGTGNLLARNLRLPIGSLDAATEIAFRGADKPIDVGVATIRTASGETQERVFLVMAGIGLDAKMVANTRADLKKHVGWLAYVDGVVRSLPKAEPFGIRYSVAGRTDRPAHISTILIANCGVLPGNLQMMPDALLDDGILDIAVLQPKGLFGWLKIWRRVTWENGVLRRSAVGRRMISLTEKGNERTMTMLRGPDIRIVLEVPQEFELDGDEYGKVRSVSFRADHLALTVRVPASPAAARAA